MEYRHTQIGKVMIAGQAFMIIGLVYLFGTQRLVVPLTTWAGALLIIGLMSLFWSLTVEVREGFVRIWFGPGLIRRRIPLRDIVSVRAVRNPWFAGWGIRWMPTKYWLWNVSGFDAVELEFKDGRRFRIGTDEPNELVQAIQHAM